MTQRIGYAIGDKLVYFEPTRCNRLWLTLLSAGLFVGIVLLKLRHPTQRIVRLSSSITSEA